MAMNSISITYEDDGQERTIFRLPQTHSPHQDSVLAFSLPKAGSVLLDKVIQYLSLGGAHLRIDLERVLPHGLARRTGAESTFRYISSKRLLLRWISLFSDKYSIPILESVRSILLLRDPRDMLFSHYFSTERKSP